jgi:Tfp pilus assembly protein PilP
MLSTKTNKIIAGLLIVGAVLSTGTLAFAKENKRKLSSVKISSFSEKARGFKGQFGLDIKTKLESLVKSETITQAQADQITNYIKTKEDERKAEADKIKGMSESERKAYFEQNKAQLKTDIFKDLVAQNIVSQAQADAITTLVNKHDNKGPKDFSAKFDSAVKDGTITQAQKDQITSYMQTKESERKAEGDKLKGMTLSERKAYLEQNKSQLKIDMFKDLIDQNIISETQAEALKKLNPMHQNKAFKGPRNQQG